MLDEDSLVVTYNDWRGEPRSRHLKSAEGRKVGDCIDCNACVAVCPAGIDIRDGQQLECITCALCIDACDAIMEKVGRPKGLISYSTLRNYNSAVAGKPIHVSLRSFIRPRTFVYVGVWVGIGVAMLITLANRERLDISVLQDRNPLFVKLSDGSIRNGYTIKIMNMEQRPRQFTLALEDLPGATMEMTGSDLPPARSLNVDVEADKLRAIKVYVTAPLGDLVHEQTDFKFDVAENTVGREPEKREYSAFFHAPVNGEKQ
jgi:cytochrome c oxidase accessory protein FixG